QCNTGCRRCQPPGPRPPRGTCFLMSRAAWISTLSCGLIFDLRKGLPHRNETLLRPQPGNIDPEIGDRDRVQDALCVGSDRYKALLVQVVELCPRRSIWVDQPELAHAGPLIGAHFFTAII